jgi:serine protease Do
MAEQFQVKEKEGVLVAQIHQGTGAEKAGLVSGDIIKSVDDKTIKNTNELIKEIQKKKVGQKVKLSVVRDGKPMTIEITTTAMPDKPEAIKEKEMEEKVGARVQELTPQLAARYRISSEIKRGVVIISVEEGSPADDIGLQEGDIIIEINRKKIETIKDFEKAIKDIPLEKGIVFRLHRRGNTFYHSFKKQP